LQSHINKNDPFFLLSLYGSIHGKKGQLHY